MFVLERSWCYLKWIDFRENLFSWMIFFDISRWLIFANGQILKILREQIFANEVISNISLEFILPKDQFFFFILIKNDIKSIIMEKILKKLSFVNTPCSFTSYQTEITSFIIMLQLKFIHHQFLHWTHQKCFHLHLRILTFIVINEGRDIHISFCLGLVTIDFLQQIDIMKWIQIL